MQMKNDNGKFIFHYILNKLVGFEYTSNSGTKEYLYIRNIQGDITSIIDTEGNIICTYAYDGYGNQFVSSPNQMDSNHFHKFVFQFQIHHQ